MITDDGFEAGMASPLGCVLLQVLRGNVCFAFESDNRSASLLERLSAAPFSPYLQHDNRSRRVETEEMARSSKRFRVKQRAERVSEREL